MMIIISVDEASPRTQRPACNMEVVVIVHARRTTTSELELPVNIQEVIITKAKRKLIASETEFRLQHRRSCCGNPFNINNNFKTATAPFSTTTNRLRLHVQLQLSKLTARSHTQRDDDDNTA